MAMLAEEERRMISKRTKEALAAAKRRGVKLGGDRGVVPTRRVRAQAVAAIKARADARAFDLAPIIAELRASGTSLSGIAAGLSEKGIKTPRGKTTGTMTQVQRLLERM